jgi:DNA-directed RNA polymerase III subunit RPC1
MEIVDTELKSSRYQAECAPVFMNALRNFIQGNIANRLAKVRKSHGMYDALEKPTDWDIDMDLSMGAPRKFIGVLRIHSLTFIAFSCYSNRCRQQS